MIDPENRVLRMRRQLLRTRARLHTKHLKRCPDCDFLLGAASDALHEAFHTAIVAQRAEVVPDHLPDSWTEGGQ